MLVPRLPPSSGEASQHPPSLKWGPPSLKRGRQPPGHLTLALPAGCYTTRMSPEWKPGRLGSRQGLPAGMVQRAQAKSMENGQGTTRAGGAPLVGAQIAPNFISRKRTQSEKRLGVASVPRRSRIAVCRGWAMPATWSPASACAEHSVLPSRFHRCRRLNSGP